MKAEVQSVTIGILDLVRVCTYIFTFIMSMDYVNGVERGLRLKKILKELNNTTDGLKQSKESNVKIDGKKKK